MVQCHVYVLYRQAAAANVIYVHGAEDYMRHYRELWGFVCKLWGIMGSYGALWVAMGHYGELWGFVLKLWDIKEIHVKF